MKLILLCFKFVIFVSLAFVIYLYWKNNESTIKEYLKVKKRKVFGIVFWIWFGIFLILFGYQANILLNDSNRLQNVINQEDKRNWLRDKYIERGRFLDRNDSLLAYTDVEENYSRRYINVEEMAHLLGYISAERMERTGLERWFNPELSGRFSFWYSLWHPVKFVHNIVSMNKEGKDINLTIDIELQKVAYAELRGRKGAAVGINPNTGEILFLVSSPGYNPENMYEPTRWASILEREALLNRAIEGLYEPGSTFKVIVSAAAIENNKSGFTIECISEGFVPKGVSRAIRDHGGEVHGRTDLSKALKKSCNVYFAQLGIELGEEILKKYAEKFMFNASIPLKVSRPILNVKRSYFPPVEDIDENALAWSSIGQYKLQITPFHMAVIASIIANNGVFVEPLIEKDLGSGGSKRIIALDTSIRLRQMMYEVVGDPEKDYAGPATWGDRRRFGTGWPAIVRGLQVGGKTGTAENPHGKPHGWFMGFAPVERPEIAFAVLVENGGYGAEVSAPIAKEILKTAKKQGYFDKK